MMLSLRSRVLCAIFMLGRTNDVGSRELIHVHGEKIWFNSDVVIDYIDVMAILHMRHRYNGLK